jgi:hypothetical protein
MVLAVVEVHGHPECVLIAESLETVSAQFNVLRQRARRDGYHAEMTLLENSFDSGLDTSSPMV